MPEATGTDETGDSGDSLPAMQYRQGEASRRNQPRRRPSRRALLAAVGVAAGGALAGCFGARSPAETREFRADPVGLPTAAREELVLTESVRDELVDESVRTVDEERLRIRLVNRGAGYRRVRDEATLLESYVDAATDRAASGAVVVPASRLGLGADAMAAGLWDGWELPVERVGLLVPEGARGDGDVALDETLALASGDAAGVAEVEVGTDAIVGLFVRPADVLPAEQYLPDEFHVPDEYYIPDGFTTPGGFDAGGVLYLDVEQRATRLFDRVELPGEPVDRDDPVDLANVMLAAPGDAVFDHPNGLDPEATFDMGDAAPLAGREFGLAGLSTPRATVDGESVTPLLDTAVADLLGHDHSRRLLGELDVTNAEDVEWRRGPVAIDPAWYDPPGTAFLGVDVELTAYGGVLTGVNGPQAAVVYAADGRDGDRVVGFGVAGRPVGTPDGRDAIVGEDGFVRPERFARAAELAAAGTSELVHGEEEAADGTASSG